jgi:glycosyltransferase involved in cell wall biosynthesis
MTITIVMGFFLPVPAERGGATEKSWSQLAIELAARGHDVTIVSRQWPRWPARETLKGVHHRRLPGYNHRRTLWQNLLLDFRWSLRVARQLPTADIVVVHAVALPVWLGLLKPSAGRVVVMPGRMPRGQYRLYRRISRVLATSTPVRERVLAENPSLAPVTRVCGYPINWAQLAHPRPPASAEVVLGYVGRLHPEKGIDLLVTAAAQLQSDPSVPSWRLVLCGPHEIADGGGGAAYRAQLEERLRRALPANRWSIRPPVYQASALADFYRSLDVFCYPSLAGGETFGVSVAEAMAAGAVPVVSDLACFRDFVRPGVNGAVFPHTGPDAAGELARALRPLIGDAGRRRALAATAQANVQRYDFANYATALLDDFSSLIGHSPQGDLVPSAS